MFKAMESAETRRIMAHNYVEHVASLLSSPAAVPSVLHRCLGARENIVPLLPRAKKEEL